MGLSARRLFLLPRRDVALLGSSLRFFFAHVVFAARLQVVLDFAASCLLRPERAKAVMAFPTLSRFWAIRAIHKNHGVGQKRGKPKREQAWTGNSHDERSQAAAGMNSVHDVALEAERQRRKNADRHALVVTQAAEPLNSGGAAGLSSTCAITASGEAAQRQGRPKVQVSPTEIKQADT